MTCYIPPKGKCEVYWAILRNYQQSVIGYYKLYSKIQGENHIHIGLIPVCTEVNGNIEVIADTERKVHYRRGNSSTLFLYVSVFKCLDNFITNSRIIRFGIKITLKLKKNLFYF